MYDFPKISIITPSFNQGEYIEETICSVLDQRYPNLEYIIIDGGSTDNSVEVIKKYQKYLYYWVSEKDEGHAHALNKGFAKSSGEIMAWINSDDKYLPWTFQTVSSIFEELPQVKWIQGNPSVWDAEGRLIESRQSQKNALDLIVGNFEWIQQESTFWRRSLWEKSGGYIDSSYRFMVDGELWSRFFLYEELFRVNRIIGGFRVHHANRSINNYNECLKEMQTICHILKGKILGERIPHLHYNAIIFYKKIPGMFKNRLSNKFINNLLRNYKYLYLDKRTDKWELLHSNYYIN